MYNKYFDRMRKYARILIDEDCRNELLAFLDSESISVRFDSACLLYNFYPDKCTETLEEISEMSVPNGLPKCFVILSVAAHANLKHDIPKFFRNKFTGIQMILHTGFYAIS